MYPPSYNADAFVEKVIQHPEVMIPVMVIGMGFGFIEYIYCAIMTRRNGTSPFPVHMHTYYLAHDFLFVLLFKQWFFEYDSVVYQFMWMGMVAFNLFEIYSLYITVKYERQEAFGKYYDQPVTERQATAWVVGMTLFCFVLMCTVRAFTNDKLMLIVFISTNVMMDISPALLTMQKRVRYKHSLGLAFFIVLGTIATFLPSGLGQYTTGAGDFFSRSLFYLLGIACTIIAIWHYRVLRKMPISPAPIRHA